MLENRQNLSILNKELRGYLDCGDIDTFLKTLYNADAQLYSMCKKNDSQLAYIRYQHKLSLLVRNVFTAKGVAKLSQLCKSEVQPSRNAGNNLKEDNIIIILNNASQLAHVTVLKALLRIWPSNFPKVYIYVLYPGSTADLTSLKDYLGLNNNQFLNIDNPRSFDIRCLYKLISSLNPKGIFWWAWPPGQWLSFLLCEQANNYSVSFKYDFPTLGKFKAHLYSCGNVYGNLIKYKSLDLVFFDLFFNKTDMSVSENSLSNSWANKYPNLKIFGILAREEKVAQKQYLQTICTILKRAPNSIFVWTGRTQRKDIVDYFKSEGLLQRTRWLGFVKPSKFYEIIDVYVDAFPMGSGLTYVQAGLAGKPLVALKCKDAVEPRLSYQLESYLNQQKQDNIYLLSCLSDSIEDYVNFACDYLRMTSYNKSMIADFKQLFDNAFCSEHIPYDLANKINKLISG